MSTDHLRFSPTVLRRLGEELLPYPDQGILELVRNSYDADATACTVELIDTTNPGGALRIEDDGDGMDEAAVRSGWLILGKSSKADGALTDLGRKPVGDKGLGRLGALRLGANATLRSRPRREPGVEYTVVLDWQQFDQAEIVESVPLAIQRTRTRVSHGTTVEVEHLNTSLGLREVQRLARSLVLLSDPFESELGFRAILKAAAFQNLERLVKEAYFDQAEFHMCARLDENGQAQARVLDWRGQELWSTDHRGLAKGSKPYRTAVTTFDFWAFLLDSGSFASRSATLGEVRSWLDVVGGVHIYDRKLRVAPYGDPGHDWLEINLRRARSPEERPSTNNSIGRIVIDSDPEGSLIQKTDRSGFIENESFLELKRFAGDTLEWMARERLRAREKTRQAKREEAPQGVAAAQLQLQQAAATLPADQRKPLERAVRRFKQAQEQQMRSLREDIFLYRALATVGTTAAVFAHESAKPAQEIMRMAKSIASRAKRLLGSQYDDTLSEPVALIIQSAQALKTFAGLPLYLLSREKRRAGKVDVHAAINDLIDAFRPLLTEEGIGVEVKLAPQRAYVHASVSAVESIVTNFVTNSVNAFKSEDFRGTERQVEIRSEISGERLIMRFLDSGPGIVRLDVSDVWLPGQTSTPNGTGLGLTIVRDSVRDLGGTVNALAHGDLGGAEFTVELPLIGVENGRHS